MEATVTVDPPPVGLSLEGPRPVRRVTVAFRIILAIPHLLLVAVLSIVGVFAAVVAWVAALVLGRMPDGLGDFLGGIVQYSTRVYGYVYLLTDRYPPFEFADADYPISVLLPPRGRLNRAAVLFRFVLAVPAWIVVTLVSSGLNLALLLIWLIVLIAGRMPASVFEAEAAFLRYEARAFAWLLMLTSTYPGGLFGDRPSAVVPEPPAPRAASEGSALPPPPPPPTAQPRITRLVLSKAGKRLMVVFIVIGVIVSVGQVAVAIVSGEQSTRALRHLDREYTDVVVASQEYGAKVQTCGFSGGPECLHTAEMELAFALRMFHEDLADISFPGYALGDAEGLQDATAAVIDVLYEMAATSEPGVHEVLVLRLQAAVNDMDHHYLELHDTLRFGY